MPALKTERKKKPSYHMATDDFHSDLISVSCLIYQSEARLFSIVSLSQASLNRLSLALLNPDGNQPGSNQLVSTGSLTEVHQTSA